MTNTPTNVSRPGTKKLLAASRIPRVDGASDRHEETVLRGRRRERKVLQRLLEAVRTGESRALVLRGEPGVGKTALLEYVVERAPGRVMRAAGVQSEMELAFAGLHQLCSPMMDRLECVPAPQRTALRTALGLSAGPAPDRFMVALAVLGLMAEVARERPLVCVVDDAQWLDQASAQALAFAARRVRAESVAVIFAARGPEETPELTGLPELTVTGLQEADARALLASVLPGPMDEGVLERLVSETRGNPLALLELPRGVTPGELAGGFMLPASGAIEGRIEESYRQRLDLLPAGTRRLLLVAAAEPVGDPVLVWRAAERLGIGLAAAAPAAAAELLEISDRVRFRHGLVRSAAYRAASAEERRSAHRALADATDPVADPDRRAWHAGQATAGPDEEIAKALERSAGRARARGGLAAAAALLERAAELTREPARRGERALAAARLMHQAGTPEAAVRLLAFADAAPLDALQRARLGLLRAQVSFAVSPCGDAPSLLVESATRLASLDSGLARETYLEALAAALFAGRLATGGSVREAAEAARAAPAPPGPLGAVDLLLDGLAVRFTEGYEAGMPMLRRALGALRSQDLPAEGLRWLWFACTPAVDLWDEESWEVLATRHVRLARETGALSDLPAALTSRILVHTFAGELAEAESLVEEVEVVTEATGSRFGPYGALFLAAWRGREAEAFELIEMTGRDEVRHGKGLGLTVGWTKALLCNSLGRYEDALAATEQAVRQLPEVPGAPMWALVEFIEAASRSGMPERADGALERLSETTRTSGTDWGLGIESRSRALLSEGLSAETAYKEAIDRLGRTRIRGALARSHLVYGSGCVVRIGGWMRASSCAPPTRCSRRWGWRPSRAAPSANCRPPANVSVDARPSPAGS
jgi:tetratricopeptide (TPR) repeat protein